MCAENEFRRGVNEALGGAFAKPQPGWTSSAEEIQRTAEYEAELINRLKTGQFLTATDKREARRLIAAARKAVS